MASRDETLMKLRGLARQASEDNNALEPDDEELSCYAARITKSLQSLQAQVKQNESVLEKVIEIKTRLVRYENLG